MKVVKKWKDLDKKQIIIGEDNLMFCNNIPHSMWKLLEEYEVYQVGDQDLYLWTDTISSYYFREEHLEEKA